MSERLRIDRPVIVEGRYDKIKLASILEANILTTEGFGVFREKEKTVMLRRIAEKTGVIVLTDSDGAGLVIRNYLNSILPKGSVTHLYIPEVPGKEKRKTAPSKAGTLGVEGIDAGLLRELFAPFAADAEERATSEPVTRAELYRDGFLGGSGSAEKRAALCRKLRLPSNLSSGALLAAIEVLGDGDLYRQAVMELKNEESVQ